MPNAFIADTPSAELLAEHRAAFVADFGAGRIGQHHNTYQHRARLLRQETARVEAMR
jgi:hypothetical protein